MISLVIAVTTAAGLSYALASHRAAEADLARTQTEILLHGGQFLAAAAVTENIRPGRLAWQENVGGESFAVIAEPENEKLSLASAIARGLPERLGVADPTALSAWLDAQAASKHPAFLDEGSDSSLWRACAGSMMSYYGRASGFTLAAAIAPDRQGLRPRAGEVWRIRVSAKGWSDERLVRITGNGRTPSITIFRRFGRSAQGMANDPCAPFIGQPL